MEELSRRFVHPDASRELIFMYRLRRSHVSKVLAESRKLWKMTKWSNDPLLWDIVRKYDHDDAFYDFGLGKTLASGQYIDFVESVWSAHGCNDSAVAEKLVALYRQTGDAAGAERTLERLVSSTETPSSTAIVKLLDLLRERNGFQRAREIIERFKSKMRSIDIFLEAWVKVLLMEAKYDHLDAVVRDSEFPWVILTKKNMALAGRLRFFAGDRAAAESYFDRFMAETNLRYVVQPRLVDWGTLARDLGKKTELETRLKRVFDQASCNSIFEAIAKIPALPNPPPDDFGYDGGDDIPF